MTTPSTTASIIPTAFIKDCDVEQVAASLCDSLAALARDGIGNVDEAEQQVRQLRNLLVLSQDLRRAAVETGLHQRIAALLRSPQMSLGLQSEALLVLTCLQRSNLLSPAHAPLSCDEFLALVYHVGFAITVGPATRAVPSPKARLACLLALLHHATSNPAFLLLNVPSSTSTTSTSATTSSSCCSSWLAVLSSLVLPISPSSSSSSLTAATPSSSSSSPDDYMCLCLVLQVLSRGCQLDERVRAAVCPAVPSLLHLLASLLLLPPPTDPSRHQSTAVVPSARVCAVDCLSALCHHNQANAMAVVTYSLPINNNNNNNSHNMEGEEEEEGDQQQRQGHQPDRHGSSSSSLLVEALLNCTSRDCSLSSQLAALRCLVRLCTALVASPPPGLLPSSTASSSPISGCCQWPSPPVAVRACENLVRLLRPDRPLSVRAEAATLLTELVDTSVALQRIAGMCDGLVPLIGATLINAADATAKASRHDYDDGDGSSSNNNNNNNGDVEMRASAEPHEPRKTETGPVGDAKLIAPLQDLLASVAANDEWLRRKVSDTSGLVGCVLASVESPWPCVQVSGLRCLLSLSRSAQQLRTTFCDHEAALARLLTSLVNQVPATDERVLAACLALLSNLFLSSSAVKKAFVAIEASAGAHELLSRIVSFATHSNADVRVNSVWCLMNLTYHGSASLKHLVYSCLSRESLFTLLSDVRAPQVVTCGLGLVRNVIAGSGSEVDAGMAHYGDQVVQSAVWILEGDFGIELKEQVLCIIANMASGERSRDALLGNDDLLRKVMDYMLHVNLSVQMAAVDALTNLTLDLPDGADYVGSLKRWQILETCGFIRVLNEMLTTTTEMTLFVKVKRLMERFSEHRYGLISS